MLVVGQQAFADRGWWPGDWGLLPCCNPRSSVAGGHPRALAHVAHPPRGTSWPSVQASAHCCPRTQPGSCPQPTLGSAGQPLGADPDWPFLYCLDSFPLLGRSPPPPQDSTVWVPAQTPPAQQRGSRAADEWPRAWTRPRTGALTPKGVPSSP